MDDKLSYKYLCERVYSHNTNVKDNLKLEIMIPKINELINQEEIRLFYPRNLFTEGTTIDFFLFTENKLYIVSFIGEDYFKEQITFKVIFLKDVTELKFETLKASGYEHIELTILLTDDRRLIFDSRKDTNEHWRSTYVDKIKKIIKLI